VLAIVIIINTNLPGFADSLARFGLGKESGIKIFQFLALRQEQPLCAFLQSAVIDIMAKY